MQAQTTTNIQAFEQVVNKNKLKKMQAELVDYKYDSKYLTKNMGVTRLLQEKIRSMYLMPGQHPLHFCSYATFAKVFPAPNIYQAYKAQNLNIIDMHLRYHQFVHEKLTLFKWVPSLLVIAATRFHPLSFLFPLVFTKVVDYYSFDFLLWKYSKDKIINIRNQFTPKLSKDKNILRRVMLFDRLKLDLVQQQAQMPKKYIKFGQNTQYIFHSSQNNVEQSNIYLTSIFESYMNIKTINSNTFSQITQNISQIIKQFKQYKKIENKKQLPIFLNRAHLLKYKDVNKQQIYNLSKQIQLRIRRFLEIAKYIKSGKAYMSGFTFTDLLHMNKHYDLLAPHKYNFDSNTPDIILLYGTAITYGIFKLIIKRAIKM